jgi:alpha/beta superfamily hydrolase
MIQSERDAAEESARVAADGTTERAEFRGRAGERLLTHLHLPAVAPRGGVVICSPLLGEFMRNYRREVLLARRLAHRGFVVERFHYRFTGNSDGDEEHLSFESMREDAIGAVEHVRTFVTQGPIVLVGTRWGGLVAASAAAHHADVGLAVWDPLMTSSRFFKEAFRSQLVKAMREGDEAPPTGSQLEQRLEAGEAVEVSAHRIHPNLYRSASGRSLQGELGTGPRDVLVIQVGPTGSVRSDLARQAERWQADHLRVHVEAVRAEESWWLVDERWADEAKRPLTRELITLTTGWIEDLTSQGSAA